MAVPWFRYQEKEGGREKRGAKHAANGGIIIKGALPPRGNLFISYRYKADNVVGCIYLCTLCILQNDYRMLIRVPVEWRHLHPRKHRG